MTPEATAVAKLKADIEALAHEVRSCGTARNDFDGPHFVIANGKVRREGQIIGHGAPWPGLVTACDMSLAEATALAVHHKGDHVILFWRVEPVLEHEDGPLLYLRLSFHTEPAA